MPPSSAVVAIIVPTWNERVSLPAMLSSLRSLEGDFELLFVDGGSNDSTVDWLSSQGVRVIVAEKGRGAQMAAGVDATSSPVLWFLHADCFPDPPALRAIEAAVRQGAVAGHCRPVFRDGGLPAHWMTWLYPKLASFGLVYGDAGIFVARTTYARAGGLRNWPLFEDFDLIRRLRASARGGICCVDAIVRPSARRFRGARFPLVFAQWVLLHLLFWVGVPPRWLARLYRPVRARPVSGEDEDS